MVPLSLRLHFSSAFTAPTINHSLLFSSPKGSNSFHFTSPPQISSRFFKSVSSSLARSSYSPPNSGKLRSCTVKGRLTKLKEAPAATSSTSLIKEPHKYFDQVIITVRGGDGGHGAVLTMPDQRSQGKESKNKNKRKKNKTSDSHKSSYRRDFDGSLILPVGGHGGDVVIYADEGKDSLLEFHEKSRFSAKRGGNVDAVRVLTSQLRDGLPAPTLRVPVPLGTVVKRKNGKLLADLAQPGDEVLVARGGHGGISLLDAPENRKKRLMSLTTNVMRDESDKVLTHGQPGQEVSLELVLRVVADVGLVGLPNAGKSTLLAAITLAKPDIADYPFTTLMPNLGRLDGDPNLGPGMYSSEATLADLPGLIEGAHLGKELRMYNPEYLLRPYIVVLNKIDLPEARDRIPSLTEEISTIGSDMIPSKPLMVSEESKSPTVESGNNESQQVSGKDKRDKEIEDYPRPLAVVGVSVLKGIRVNEMLKEIRGALRKCRDSVEELEPSARP
ncbi:hypothetical protein Tsubulata_030322 [Turnera subulata]|uniref:GTP-binding protein OBGC2 n=1 Tax=Turnera subulata TaxID=218843 RepID=A0A9Q0F3B0_9ROSI|nr:hypothetical protein Tsubulata_030322 [Turnera subulata]